MVAQTELENNQVVECSSVANCSPDRIPIQITQYTYLGVMYSFLYPSGEQLPPHFCVSIALTYIKVQRFKTDFSLTELTIVTY